METIPVYISLTSIFQNQHILFKTLLSITNQTHKPYKCFIYLSEEPFLLDKGFKNKIITDKHLKNIIQNHSELFQIVWVQNIGPYRKLLPLLKDKWNEDCFIITIDDDTEYHPKLIENMLFYYNIHNCVISFRGFTLKKNNNNMFTYEDRNALIPFHLYNFPTGKGGVLYKPQFFHNTHDLIFNQNIYLQFSKTTDDIWFFFIRLCNNISCFVSNESYMLKDNTSTSGLFINFNSKNKLNTKNMTNIYKLLTQIGYNI